ncbi:MAG: YheC/YheD family protein [Syntrophomonadaceae bacterium]|nr:YheC/YheD family protein [Syntrophomonadaceae bacterium]
MADKVIVGVLTTPRSKGRHSVPVGRDSVLKKEMISMADSLGIFLYFFYPQGIDFSKNEVSGHTYLFTNKQKGYWLKSIFPLPHIVYNRLSYRKNEAQKSVKELLAAIENNPRMYLFNSRFLDKWEVHVVLSQDSLTKHLVPETVRFNRANLNIMLDKYQDLFIKPINKSIGKGIIKIQRDSSKLIKYKLAASNDKWHQCRSAAQLYKGLKTNAAHDQYLIQSGINLATTSKRVFDLRTEVQKDERGEWVFTGVGVRVAAPGRYCTHVPNGGSRAEYNKVIQKVFGDSNLIIENLDRQLSYITQAVPYVLEKNLGINLGILSIDIGIDKSGIMQIIEVNSKPSSFDEKEIRSRHLENLNKYFLYIYSQQIN